MNNGTHAQGTQCTKMGADSLAKNTPNAPVFTCTICLHNPKSSGLQWKKKSSLGVVVHGLDWQKEKEYYVGILLFFHEYLTTGLNNVMTLLNALHTALRKFSQTYRVTPTSC